MATTQVRGYASPARGPVTADTLGFNSVTSVIEREVGTEILYLDPSAAPYTLLSDKSGNDTTDNPRYEWYEKALRDKTTLLEADNGDVEGNAGTTELGISGTDVVVPGDLVFNTVTREIYLVVSRTDSNSFQVVRGAAGSTASASGADGDPLCVIGSAFAEGVGAPATDEWLETQVHNFTQIFRRAFGGSATREATQTYFGRGYRDRLAKEKGIEFAMDIERAAIAGGRSEVQASGAATPTLGTGVLRTSGGFLFYATQNILDLNGAALSEPTFEAALEPIFARTASGDTRTLFAGTPFITVLDQMAVDKIRTVNDPSMTYGIAVKQYLTFHGTLNVIKHRILADLGNDINRGGLIVDVKKLGLRTLSGRATKLKKNIQAPDVDGWIDEYKAELGFVLENPEVHGTVREAALAA
jgi:Family of unknown function (DUF5309)